LKRKIRQEQGDERYNKCGRCKNYKSLRCVTQPWVVDECDVKEDEFCSDSFNRNLSDY
jgi:hypothetical protein